MDSWKAFKTSGSYKRQVKENVQQIYSSIDQNALPEHGELLESSASSSAPGHLVLNQPEDEAMEEAINRINEGAGATEPDDADSVDGDLPNVAEYQADETEADIELLEDLKRWTLSFNVRHTAVKALLKILNKRLSNTLPQDPRTLLKTTQTVSLLPVGEGQYWHHGFKPCIEKVFSEITHPITISIKINMDGLPIYKSSKDECWPILFNIDEYPYIKPMVIGIYSGKHKPSDLSAFLNPFVEEMEDVCKNGIFINGFKITVVIRCFVCDSPARSFVKGVANFNAQNGCQQCVCQGEYSYVSHTNFYPQISCPKRTDAGFRNRSYGSHHKTDSPLLRLPIDMIRAFPVGDSLHLIDLGIMKKLLLGWRDGNVGTYRTKWPARVSIEISKKLLQLRTPVEIHRSMRGLDCLSHWKGSEYRTFLHYASIVVLKPVLPPEVYEHFLVFFCAVTICSSEMYSFMLDLAHQLLTHFLEQFKSMYGEDYISSNFHNLNHLVEDVKRFGPLHKFNAYPFESKLYEIKNLVRTGSKPLVQIAKRLSELNQITKNASFNPDSKDPVLKNEILNPQPSDQKLSGEANNSRSFSKIDWRNFTLSTDPTNKWFLTNDNKIVALKCITEQDGLIQLAGCKINNMNLFFETPIRSSVLHIYESDGHVGPVTSYELSNVKCKMVRIPFDDSDVVFIPLLHTL